MATEVSRSNWSRFIKRFNFTNQYRPVRIRVKQKGAGEVEISRDDPLMGIVLTKRGRFIDGVALFTAKNDPDKLAEPTILLKGPVKISSDRDKTKKDLWLSVEGKDGTRIKMELAGDRDTQKVRSCVEKLAYTIYERRGHQGGHDMEDWLEAERLLSDTANQLS